MAGTKVHGILRPVVDNRTDEDKRKAAADIARRRKTALGSAPASAGNMQNVSRTSRSSSLQKGY